LNTARKRKKKRKRPNNYWRAIECPKAAHPDKDDNKLLDGSHDAGDLHMDWGGCDNEFHGDQDQPANPRVWRIPD
jgi:hypothetical protein